MLPALHRIIIVQISASFLTASCSLLPLPVSHVKRTLGCASVKVTDEARLEGEMEVKE